MSSSRSSYLLPDLALLYAAIMWGLFWYPLRLFENAGLPAIWVTLVAFGCAFIVGAIFTYRQRHEYRLHVPTQIVLALSAGWCNAAFLVALVEGNAIRVILLFYLSPVWTVLLGHFILKEKLTSRALMIFGLAFVGAMIMLWDPVMGIPWPQNTSDWLALSSGMGFALSNVLIRSLQQVSIAVKTTFSWLGCIVIAAAWILIVGYELPAVAESIWYYSILLGVFGVVFMGLSVQYGVTHMPVYRSAIILLFEIPVTAVSVYWLVGETMSPLEWTGGGIVALSAWLVARMEKSSA